MSQVDEKDLKLQVAKAIRLLETIELLDMHGHVSCRIPGTDCFFINSRKASRASVTVDDIVMCDMNGKLVEGDSEPPSEYHIHTEIFKRRSDVMSVIHNHPHYQTVLGIAGMAMKPVFGIGAFVNNVPVYEKSSLINTAEMGAELAESLGNEISVQLRNHGTVVAAESVKAAFARSVFLEENAKKQYDAMLLGQDTRVLEGDNLLRTRETAWQPSIIQKVWTYHEEKAIKQGDLVGINDPSPKTVLS
ncbi:class II aldolase/adducin family protein [Fictibacillus terranigra]|uniref:Class II aldolase/adducin family protein n=1 Tax=Fictibacillus terranigra TaxID=3058424 RepID=A0ABT8EC28_9BACL|nr:class II aldolase/adducin family protein [Fictibacillus sp. CENA-BCM004]MDN4075432.1 class II aldolase/adducin family protein [Fictibacillus sp. CENA-BCM004]